jgi:hypothetical protein
MDTTTRDDLLAEELASDDATERICTDMGITPAQLFWYQAVKNGQMDIETVLRDKLLDGRTAWKLGIANVREVYRLTGRWPYTIEEDLAAYRQMERWIY